ncbi:hypothetical protein GCM10017744_013320 [Streptomyces antimycoticus]
MALGAAPGSDFSWRAIVEPIQSRSGCGTDAGAGSVPASWSGSVVEAVAGTRVARTAAVTAAPSAPMACGERRREGARWAPLPDFRDICSSDPFRNDGMRAERRT